ncbi:hypothetical protein C5F49_00370 [Nitrosopumilus oxyclinae]|uniref:Uncharacterized protein n=1 Tax=Nitrosopumilus oxyclinae TaxID=1959104 RepID=A0A7D5M0I0_9ARCH|nr:hypothetical protein [Nitrosopumilus oxyclinae]QLH03946.1 hypothetical protein C5F49_00370 [Nitrosopumilus oxyclinae]
MSTNTGLSTRDNDSTSSTLASFTTSTTSEIVRDSVYGLSTRIMSANPKSSASDKDMIFERGHCTTLKEYFCCCVSESDCQKSTVVESVSSAITHPLGNALPLPSEFDVKPRIAVSSVPYVRELIDTCQLSSSNPPGARVGC